MYWIDHTLCILCVSFILELLMTRTEKSDCSYHIRVNNVFRRIGIPGPAPIPLLGEIMHVMRKVMSD